MDSSDVEKITKTQVTVERVEKDVDTIHDLISTHFSEDQHNFGLINTNLAVIDQKLFTNALTLDTIKDEVKAIATKQTADQMEKANAKGWITGAKFIVGIICAVIGGIITLAVRAAIER